MRVNKIILPAVAVFIAMFVSACGTTGGYGNSGNPDNGYSKPTIDEEVDTGQEVEENQTITVTIKNFTFEPALVTASAGDTVVFVNEDGAPHTATATGGAFDTGNLASGESGSVTLVHAGTYEYFCAIHPAMKGTIVVEQ